MGTINVDNIKGADGGAVTSLDVEKIDTPGDLTIDVDGGTISIQDGGTEVGKIDTVVADGDLIIESVISNGDVKIKGNDGGSTIVPVNVDMSGNVVCFGNDLDRPASTAVVGIAAFCENGHFQVTTQDSVAVAFGRNVDGSILVFYGNGTSEGAVSLSGNTVSYGAFTGTHPSRFSDNSKPTMLRGTVLETIDEKMDWYLLEFEQGKDKSGNTIPTTKIPYLKPDDKNVGDTVEYNYVHPRTKKSEGIYTAKVTLKGDEKHVKCKVSDTADSTRVYGVFMCYDEESETTADGVNDIYTAAVGTFPVRIHKDETLVAGDLIVSNGDGTAKKQSDDIVRTKTIGKILANVKVETYSDGSYTLPCALYCG